MNKVIVSASLLALGAVSAYDVRAEIAAGSEKPWTLNATLRGFYDDNYNTQPSGTNRVGSFGFEVRPSISIIHNDGPNSLSAAYYYSFRYYGARPNNNYDQDHLFEAAFTHRFNTVDSVGVVESFVDSQEPTILNPGSPASQPFRANGDNFHNTFAINYKKQVNHLLGFIVSYANNWYRYDGSFPIPPSATNDVASYGTLLNRIEHSATIDSRFTVNDQTTAVFGYQFQWVDHMSGASINGPVINASNPYFPGTARNVFSHYGYLGVDHNFSDTLKGSARGGFLYMDFYNQDITPYSASVTAPTSLTPYFDLSLVWDYRDDGSFKVGFTESQNATDVSTTYNEVTSTVFGSITQILTPLSPHLTATMSGTFENAEYNGGTSNDGVDRVYDLGFNFAYQFNRFLGAELGYNYDRLTSSTPGRAYYRDRVYIGATASY